MKINCRLTRIISSHNNLRTDVVEGHCWNMPVEGERFQMEAPPLEKFGHDMVRMVITSPVRRLSRTGDNNFELETLNSIYHLEIL